MKKLPYNRMRREHFFMIDNDYVKLYAKHLGVVATAVFTSLNMHADADGRCFPSMELIAEQHGIDRHTVSKALKKLEEWNMILVGRAYNRSLKKRKNNEYTVIPINFWNGLPEGDQVVDSIDYGIKTTIEDNEIPFAIIDRDKSHGNKDAMYVASKIPDGGTEYTSNKTHTIKTKEEKSLCGLTPTVPHKENTSLKTLAVWNSVQAVQALVESGYKDYQIIGTYFYIQEYFFEDESAFKTGIERLLRVAKILKEYEMDDIKKTMKWLSDQDFELDWSLEAVRHYIDDCISTDFILDGKERTEQLNIINA